MDMAKILIVDDEANLRKVLRTLLEQDGHQPHAVADGHAALDFLKHNDMDLVITDLKMPKMTGLQLLHAVQQLRPGLPVILITAHGTVDTAVSALKNGAFDYITKPFERAELKLAVRKAAAVHIQLSTRLQDPGTDTGRFQIIGQSKCMVDVYTMIEKVASTPSTVLISGESGTGKELVATALHQASPRKRKPFIKVNCGAIPKDLMESEFFGYEQGAFTGAVSAKPGRFELADGGTLFLDEISEIPINMQVKLLRALQESEFERVGGIRTQRVDVRVVAASNRDLNEEVASGRFREDLFYRLNVVPIHVPALRDRLDDIPLLAHHFLDKAAKRLHKQVRRLSSQVFQAFQMHAWPGNIRELENVIERMVLLSDSETVNVDDLPDELRVFSQQETKLTQQVSNRATAPHTIATDAYGNSSLKDIIRRATNDIKRDLIVYALKQTKGNVTHAAHMLQISRKSLQNTMKEFGLRES